MLNLSSHRSTNLSQNVQFSTTHTPGQTATVKLTTQSPQQVFRGAHTEPLPCGAKTIFQQYLNWKS